MHVLVNKLIPLRKYKFDTEREQMRLKLFRPCGFLSNKQKPVKAGQSAAVHDMWAIGEYYQCIIFLAYWIWNQIPHD